MRLNFSTDSCHWDLDQTIVNIDIKLLICSLFHSYVLLNDRLAFFKHNTAAGVVILADVCQHCYLFHFSLLPFFLSLLLTPSLSLFLSSYLLIPVQ